MKEYIDDLLYTIMESIDEGIHVIDKDGRTIFYNKAMEKMEGMDREEVLNKKLLNVFPTLDKDTSTLLKALEKGQAIKERPQIYYNNQNKEITTINNTIPIIKDKAIMGAIEIARNITKIKELSAEVVQLQRKLQERNDKTMKKKFTFDSIIGHSENFIKSIEYAKGASNYSSSVLIYGETGTGKELVAQSIHYGSRRADKPFIGQNCAAIPESLLESILFGTEKGSFTGAMRKVGLFEHANGGTLFLDEINSMGEKLQSKLLRVLQEKTIRRVGGLKDIVVDVRIIASTNEEPYKMIEEKRLRKDLFYRINVMPVNLPPLRERTEDIEILVEHFIDKYNRKSNVKIKKVDKDIIRYFKKYNWPGNIRELENYIHGAVNVASEDEILKKEHFSPHVNTNVFKFHPESKYKLKGTLSDTLMAIEKEMIREALDLNKGNISKSANYLGIKRQTLQHKLKKYKM
ncbi:MAG: sigma 54-interacting transcriptional regulator [Anaeromicrobium sp.]|jgi:arginine utilization regulatory protein|uniref:sigma-54 interaction domain-containing protein n=1 Tax=Anaeromicrobium sp. TaxID=1929132 RepID=UPI0025FA2799|nr:sigma 54-interacting transcriptional regulator [Anaeromicrobium sp.]MCT4595146.1 sigma 54-interacting transcriptional regulator [Anaeromicrobium sp.]